MWSVELRQRAWAEVIATLVVMNLTLVLRTGAAESFRFADHLRGRATRLNRLVYSQPSSLVR